MFASLISFACAVVGRNVLFALVLFSLFVSAQLRAIEGSYAERAKVQVFIENLVGKGAEREPLELFFKQLTPDQEVLDLMQRAPERKASWPGYRSIFIGEDRISDGLAFMREYADLLKQAETDYGVPGKVIVAILGVETFYGRITGRKKVARSLATLAFDYPRRGEFFRGELEAFLRICREQGLDPHGPMGSYAGAMGYPQFMPSSYLHYAVDFNQDERIDIWQDPVDAIGSIANYLQQAGGWRANRAMLEQVDPTDEDGFVAMAKATSLRPSVSVEQLAAFGVTPARLLQDDRLSLLVVDHPQKEGKQYWIGGRNFYAVTRYNISAFYALVVHQLAELLSARMAQSQ